MIAEWNAGELFPRSIDACHSCDNPPCCLGAHLFKGTRADNMRDAARKGRVPALAAVSRRLRKLSDDDVRAIRVALAEGKSARALGRKYGVNHKNIRELLSGKRYADVPDAAGPVQTPLFGGAP